MSRSAAGGRGRWTPRRRGAIYCSPGCGYSCTWQAHQEAHRKGKALLRRIRALGGTGWAVHVWENCGWHYRLVSLPPYGGVQIHDSGSSERPRYSALIGSDEGNNGGTWSVEAPSLRALMHAALQVIIDGSPAHTHTRAIASLLRIHRRGQADTPGVKLRTAALAWSAYAAVPPEDDKDKKGRALWKGLERAALAYAAERAPAGWRPGRRAWS